MLTVVHRDAQMMLQGLLAAKDSVTLWSLVT